MNAEVDGGVCRVGLSEPILKTEKRISKNKNETVRVLEHERGLKNILISMSILNDERRL